MVALEATSGAGLIVDLLMSRTEQALDSDPPRLLDLKGSREIKLLLAQQSLSGEDSDDEEGGDAREDDAVDENARRWEDAIARCPELPEPDAYDHDAISEALAQDRATIAELLAALPDQADDGKIDALLQALTQIARNDARGKPALAGRNGILIFSQFRDTARYVHRRLAAHADQLGHVEITDGAVTSEQRRERTAFFDPDRHEAARMHAEANGSPIPKILVSTDVLAEGHNLQIADVVINFDLHFNPQVALQRCGRIDRLGSKNKRVHLVSMHRPRTSTGTAPYRPTRRALPSHPRPRAR